MRVTARLTSPADVGVVLQQARLERGLSQAELAAEVGFPQSVISQMESGQSSAYLRRLLRLAGATVIDLRASLEADDAPGGLTLWHRYRHAGRGSSHVRLHRDLGGAREVRVGESGAVDDYPAGDAGPSPPRRTPAQLVHRAAAGG